VLMRYQAYQEERQVLAAIADDLRQVLDRRGLHSLAVPIGEAAERFGSERLRVVFVGSFKSGKSSLVNALLGREVLPVAAHPTSPVILIVRWAPGPPTAEILDEAGKGLPVSPDVLDRYVLGGDEAPSVFRTVMLGVDADLPRYGLELVDTPGLLDDVSLQRSLLAHLATADVAVFVKSIFPFTDEEFTLVERAREIVGDRMIFALNRIDQLVDPDSVVAVLREQLTTHLDDPSPVLVPISARLALAALKTADARELQMSGLPRFEEALATLLSQTVVPHKLRLFAASVESHIKAARQVGRAVEDGKRAELVARAREIDTALDQVVDQTRTLAARRGEEFFERLADDVPQWASTPSVTSLNPLRTPKQVEAAARLITDELGERLQREVARWTQEVLLPLLRARWDELLDNMSDRLGQIALVPPSVDAFQPRMTSMPAAYVGSLGAAIAATSPVSLLGVVAAAGLLARQWSKGAGRELRERVVEHSQASIRDRAPDFGRAIADVVTDYFDRLREEVADILQDSEALTADAAAPLTTELAAIEARLTRVRT